MLPTGIYLKFFKTQIPIFVQIKIMNQLLHHVSNNLLRRAGFEFKDGLEGGISEIINFSRTSASGQQI